MIVDLKGYRVFIASPGGLQEERKAFRDALVAFNEAHAVQKGAIFLPVGWEDTPGGLGRGQDHINMELRTCDYCVVLLHNKWGMPPAKDGVYGSGTEEEFYVALECREDPEMPMRDVFTFFKGVDPIQLNDPGPQLEAVLKFRKKLEEERLALYESFDTVRSFEQKLDRHLGNWLRAHEDKPAVAEPLPAYEEPAGPEPRGTVETDPPGEEGLALAEARRLASTGRRIDAEVVLARGVENSQQPAAYLEYARFLRLDRRLDQALTIAERALEFASEQGRRVAESDAYYELGMVHYDRDNLARAEESFRAALALKEELGSDDGIADCKRNIGLVLERLGDRAGAESMYRAALAIDERLNRQDGMADDYSYIGGALQRRGDLVGAERMYQEALEIDTAIGRLDAVAKHCSDLGSVMYLRGDFPGAERMYREALKLDEGLGRLNSMADDYSNLGSALSEKGDLDGAVAAHLEAAAIDESLERFDTVVDHYENVAAVEEGRGRSELATAYRDSAHIARLRASDD